MRRPIFIEGLCFKRLTTKETNPLRASQETLVGEFNISSPRPFCYEKLFLLLKKHSSKPFLLSKEKSSFQNSQFSHTCSMLLFIKSLNGPHTRARPPASTAVKLTYKVLRNTLRVPFIFSTNQAQRKTFVYHLQRQTHKIRYRFFLE